MSTLHLITNIHAPIERCFNLARSIDIHMESTSASQEKAIAGVTLGLIGLNETVTWRAKHLGKFRTLTTRITALDYPFSFTDEMTEGDFKSIKHQHLFSEKNGITTMEDVFEFEAPYGLAGKLVSFLFLQRYMKTLLLKRNAYIKNAAEG